MSAYALEWLNLVARWGHVIAGISWIGASFYFVWLDDSLTPPAKREDAENGVLGELWSVHGGGFYHNQKFLTGPKREPLSHDLHWFKWEAYTTWLSGMAMLAIVYWAGAWTYLIDSGVMALTPPAAIAISIATLLVGWFAYDALCRVFETRPVVLWCTIAALMLAIDWALFHVFGGRGAAIHVGAVIGTIMVANVFFVIIPGQQRMLAQIRAGHDPDPRPGRLGKIRSVHNTYFTLPVVFTMIANHYPMTFAAPNGWLVLAVLSACGVLVRRFFVLSHGGRLAWVLPATAAVLVAAAALAIAPRAAPDAGQRRAVSFAAIAPIVAQRCAVCHAEHPVQPGFTAAPAGVMLDTPERIVASASRIKAQAVTTHAMPLGNITHMTDDERATLGTWIDGGARR